MWSEQLLLYWWYKPWHNSNRTDTPNTNITIYSHKNNILHIGNHDISNSTHCPLLYKEHWLTVCAFSIVSLIQKVAATRNHQFPVNYFFSFFRHNAIYLTSWLVEWNMIYKLSWFPHNCQYMSGYIGLRTKHIIIIRLYIVTRKGSTLKPLTRYFNSSKPCA